MSAWRPLSPDSRILAVRKVYHTESSALGLMMALVSSVCLTVLLFGSLPFAHRLKATKTVELRDIGVKKDLDDEPEDLTEPEQPPEAEKAPEPLQAPNLTDPANQDLPLTPSLDVAVGQGGGLLGFGEVGALAGVKAAQANDIFDISDLEKRPELIAPVPPTYPKELERAKVEGSVTLLFVLNEEGRVEDPRVENSSRPEFEKPALDAIRKWRFRPGMKDGQAVRTYIRAPIRFSIPSG